jgi:hypothetical protein
MATSPIPGLTSAPGLSRLQVVHAADEPRGDEPPAVSDAAAADEDAVSVDTFPSSPPAEVSAAIAAAAEAADQLAAEGRHVSFDATEDGGIAASLTDADGRTLSELSPSDVLALADGADPDQTGKSTDVHHQRDRD